MIEQVDGLLRLKQCVQVQLTPDCLEMRPDSQKPTGTASLAGQIPPGDRGRQPKLKAVVLYADFDCGVKARALVRRAADHSGWPGEVENLLWRFDVMSQPLVAREALYRSADADILLLVAEEAAYPSAWLLEWLEIWAITRRIQDAILAAWCRGNDVGGASEGVECLRELAGRYGLEFLCAEEVARKAA